ncbi:DUF3347 domain-containing protein [Chryseobacterium sp. ISL-6]|uniref:DUF3347 domain-containing protein n=1 Tax=Chryseobacterium sp. ISL-6 TaxID=2819143 RepID=UPI001BE7BEF4|nr:DUF3347 domain-containing protein [Chryseobacterium sp. ISL-6]MBT2619414.1 DUF3347 domain-containing protein [Chryseobacterium sp. ISL-6]
MKNISLSIIAMTIIALALSSCKKSTNKTPDQTSETVELQLKENNKPTELTKTEAGKTVVEKDIKNFSIDPIIRDYLILKNALVADNDQAVAKAGKQLFTTLRNVNMKAIPADKHKEYMDIAEDAKENAEHIGNNAGKIDHQREHMASLSNDIADLIAAFGTTQKLYQDHCPMYNDGKGAIWISETKAIKNPYYGDKMLTCGSVKKEY